MENERYRISSEDMIKLYDILLTAYSDYRICYIIKGLISVPYYSQISHIYTIKNLNVIQTVLSSIEGYHYAEREESQIYKNYFLLINGTELLKALLEQLMNTVNFQEANNNKKVNVESIIKKINKICEPYMLELKRDNNGSVVLSSIYHDISEIEKLDNKINNLGKSKVDKKIQFFFQELKANFYYNHIYATAVLTGAILEGLFYRYYHNNEDQKKRFCKAQGFETLTEKCSLEQFINGSRNIYLIDDDEKKYCSIIQEYRNAIHIRKDNIDITQEKITSGISLFVTICDKLMPQIKSKNNP